MEIIYEPERLFLDNHSSYMIELPLIIQFIRTNSLFSIHSLGTCKFDIQELVHRMKSSTDTEVILQFDDYIFTNEGLEK